MRVVATAALVLVVLLSLLLLLLFLLLVSLCLLELVLLWRLRLLLLLLASQAVGNATAGGKLKPRGCSGMPEGCHVGGRSGQCWPHLARRGGVALCVGRVDMLWRRVWRGHVVGGRGGLALGREGGRNGLLALVHHMALVVGVALHHTIVEWVIVPHSNLLQVVHRCSSLDRLLIGRRLCNSQLREVRVKAS